MSDTATILRIGPELHGTKMSLAEFAPAEVVPGYTYELEQGVIVVDVPRLSHSRVVQNVRAAFTQYGIAHPGRIDLVAGGSDSVIRMPGMESERHPDVTVYLAAPPADDENPWDFWIPDIVVEVVSKSSVRRDYEIKREEYLRAGVRLYWIVDPLQRTVLMLTRKGDTWQETKLSVDATLTLTNLPDFKLALTDVFAPPNVRSTAGINSPRRVANLFGDPAARGDRGQRPLLLEDAPEALVRDLVVEHDLLHLHQRA